MTKFLLDSGDPIEYKTIAALALSHGQELWGSTTNPSLIAKKLAGQKVSMSDAFSKLQKEIVEQILTIVPGAVSAEAFSNLTTQASEMIQEGLEIATWHPSIVVKLPTTIEGFKARFELRKKGITINNTLVFSQQQVFAISLHEKLLKQEYGATSSGWPCFISPFIGRLDDKGENGLTMLLHATQMVHDLFGNDLVWMLAASIRSAMHLKASVAYGCELITAPAKIYDEWFGLSSQEQASLSDQPATALQDIPLWHPSEQLLTIQSIDELMQAITSGVLDISHPLTTACIEKVVADWQPIVI